MKGRVRDVAANVAITVASVAVSFALGEMVFRALDWSGSRPHRLLTQYDEHLGWAKIPGKVGRHVTSEYEVTERINSRGLRGPEYDYDKPDDEYRILILGDSFAEGYTVEFDHLFSEVMKQTLNRQTDTKYQVINAGTGGYSTDQELLFFQSEGKSYSPDLTILTFVVNDVWWNQSKTYWRGNKPMFELDGSQLVLTNVPVPKPQRSAGQVVDEWLITNSNLYSVARQAVKDVVRSSSGSGAAFGPVATTISGARIPINFLPFKKPYDERIRRGWTLTAALIRQMMREAAAIGSGLLVVYAPSRISADPAAWTPIVERFAGADPGWHAEWPMLELEAICERLRVDFLNLTPIFRQAVAVRNERLYFPKDGHWNESGHRLAGRVMAAYVQGIAGR